MSQLTESQIAAIAAISEQHEGLNDGAFLSVIQDEIERHEEFEHMISIGMDGLCIYLLYVEAINAKG